jgi:hypothetical protein
MAALVERLGATKATNTRLAAFAYEQKCSNNTRGVIGSDDANVLSLFTLTTRGDVEFDGLTLVERLVTVTLDVGVVNEDVIAAVA